MKIVPIQFFGLGDIIWEQTLVREIANGTEIYWPVEAHFVEGLSRAYPDITFVDKDSLDLDYRRKDEYTINGMRVLPLRFADSLCNVPYHDCMKSKYMLYGKDWKTWKQDAMWKRDTDREAQLASLLQLPVRYNLVNRYFGSHSQLQANITVKNDLPCVDMMSIPGFSLFDWASVIENATEIHTVSTSIIYVLEQLELEAPSVHLYPRLPIEVDFRNIEYILEKHQYQYHL